MLISKIFSCWDIKKGQFQFLFTFLVVFSWSVNCTNQVCISSHILNMGGKFYLRLLVFSFLVFSIFKCLKFSFSSNFRVLEKLKIWFVNYICQLCKLYFYFGHVRNFGQYLYLKVFNKHRRCPTFSFS